MQAYSSDTNITYPDWDALVEAEANGYVVVVIVTDDKGRSWPWVQGPCASQREANNLRNRTKSKIKKQQADYPQFTFKYFVRPAWKENRGPRPASARGDNP